MSYTSITTATNDAALQARVQAAVSKEAWNSTAVEDTRMAAEARISPVGAMLQLVWPVAIDTEAAYESALAANHPDPGGDPAVITDAAILSAVQAHWPDEAVPA